MKNLFFILALYLILFSCNTSRKNINPTTFSFEMNFTYPGSPEFVYDNLTGDISAWWDHSFSGNPDSLYIEAKPGGGFYEIFNDSGDGVKHATVIFAERGKMLRMEGPLGLSGTAITLICTYTLKPSGKESTILTLNVNGSGEFDVSTPEIIKGVWEHFLWDQFKPYIDKKFQEHK